MRERDKLVEVVGRIYDGALEPGAWPGIVEQIGEFIRGSRAMLFTSLHTPSQGGFAFTWRMPEFFMRQYSDQYQALDVWTRAGVDKGLFIEGDVVLDSDLVPHDQYLQSRLWKEATSQVDIARLCVGVVFGDRTPGTIPAVMSLYRGLKDRAFGASERKTLGILIPHLSRSLGIMFRLRDAELRVASSLAALDRLRQGVLLLDGQGVVCHASYAARNILGAEDGLRLQATPQGHVRLLAADPETQTRISNAIRSCVEEGRLEVPHFSRAVAVQCSSRTSHYVLHFSALPKRNEFATGAAMPRAIVFVGHPARDIRLNADVLRQSYGLTAAELRLLEQLLRSDTIAATAAALGISEGTAKTQLQSVYNKSSTHNRAQLMRLVLSLSSND